MTNEEKRLREPIDDLEHRRGLFPIATVIPAKPLKHEVICQSCGQPFEAFNLGRWSRKLCDKCGEAQRADEEEAVKKIEEEEADRRRKVRIVAARIPPIWREVSFESSNRAINPAAFKAAEEYAQNFNPMVSPSLVFFSLGYGTGKTHLAACIANYVLHVKGLSVRFQKARDLLLELRRSFSDQAGPQEGDILDFIVRFDLLILDDVGVDGLTDWRESTYWTLFDRRLEAGLPMVVTTNYALDATGDAVVLGDRIGFGSASRLRQMSRDNVLVFRGRDLR